MGPAAAKLEALRRLWAHAIRDMEIIHHDPRVAVRLGVSASWGEIEVRMDARGTRDTIDRDQFLREFGMSLKTADWPGYRAARIAIAGAWAMYMQHEVHELILLGSKRIPELDPHYSTDIGNYRQRMLEGVYEGGSAISIAMDFAVGPIASLRIQSADAPRALSELEAEIRVVQGLDATWD